MRRGFRLLALTACGAVAAHAAAAQEPEAAFRVEREVERLAARSVLWPGFDPLDVPLAIYTGEGTYLFRHPSPPAGFARLEDGGSNAFGFEGRHPAVTANSSAEIGGVVTATLSADGARAGLPAMELAATAVHEAFHVFQRGRHPGWSGNEGDLFLYPVDDPRLLELRRLESAALGRALGAADPASTACWARLALRFRRERFAGMDSAFSTYERLTELNEGLATYVQTIAGGRTTIEIPPSEFPPAKVRDRTYVIGPALGFLLDRLRPGWQAALEADDRQFLDGMLESALVADRQEGAGECALGAGELAGIQRAAREDAAAVIAARAERRKVFESRSGWRVVVQAADGEPLWPKGFDPLNVERVDGGLLHSRFLDLGGDAGELRVIDEADADVETLTEGAGPHPLFNGVRRLTIAGLAKPTIETEGGEVTIRAPGCTAHFKSAAAEVNGTEVVVRLHPKKGAAGWRHDRGSLPGEAEAE